MLTAMNNKRPLEGRNWTPGEGFENVGGMVVEA